MLVIANGREFLALHVDWTAMHKHNVGIVTVVQQRYSFGELIRRLGALSAARESEDLVDRVEFLSRWGAAR